MVDRLSPPGWRAHDASRPVDAAQMRPPAGLLPHVLLQGTLVTRWITRGTLFGGRQVVILHALGLSGTRLPKEGLMGWRTDHLYVLHHAAILMAEDVAVQDGLTGEVGGHDANLRIARTVSRRTAPTDGHFTVCGRYPVTFPGQLLTLMRVGTDLRTLLLCIAMAGERTRGQVPTVPLFGYRNGILPHGRGVRQDRDGGIVGTVWRTLDHESRLD